MSGGGTDPDGAIVAYSWAKVSGPSTGTIVNPTSANTQINNLSQGTYVFRLTVTDNSGATATDDVTVTVQQPTGTFTRIQAENYSSMSGIQTEATADAGGGLNVGWQDTNDWMNYSVNLTTAGLRTVNFRVASYFTGAQFQLRKSDGTVLATLVCPNTGSFQNWTTISTQVNLPAGAQTLRIYTTAANGGWNINWWEIEDNMTGGRAGQSVIVEDTRPLVRAEAVEIYPNPVADQFQLVIDNPFTGAVTVQLVNASGAPVKSYQLNKPVAGSWRVNIPAAELGNGIYIMQVNMKQWKGVKKLVKQ